MNRALSADLQQAAKAHCNRYHAPSFFAAVLTPLHGIDHGAFLIYTSKLLANAVPCEKDFLL
jgi:hydrogenase/urease accessory protein HupE